MRGGANVNKVHLKKGDQDFIVLVESADALEQWKKDSSIPLAQVVDGFKVFTTHGQGVQGILDTASKGTLSSAFDNAKEDDIIEIILREGQLQTTSAATRESSTNDSKGSLANHR